MLKFSGAPWLVNTWMCCEGDVTPTSEKGTEALSLRLSQTQLCVSSLGYLGLVSL